MNGNLEPLFTDGVTCHFCGDTIIMKPGPKAPVWGQCPTCKSRIFGTPASAELYLSGGIKKKREKPSAPPEASTAQKVSARDRQPTPSSGQDHLPEEWGGDLSNKEKMDDYIGDVVESKVAPLVKEIQELKALLAESSSKSTGPEATSPPTEEPPVDEPAMAEEPASEAAQPGAPEEGPSQVEPKVEPKVEPEEDHWLELDMTY